MEEQSKYYPRNKKYAEKYLAKFEDIKLRMLPEEKERLQELAKAEGKSVNQFIKDKIFGE